MNKYILVLLCTFAFSVSADNLRINLKNGDVQVSNAKVTIHQLYISKKTNSEGYVEFENIANETYSIDVQINDHEQYDFEITHKDDSLQSLNIKDVGIDNVVVYSNPLEHSSLKMTTPSQVISEEDLILNRGLNINETLSQMAGVDSASFGSGAGQPVIRGQQGNRVSVLNNNSSTQDAANVSPDHWISVEPLLATKIEVLKGPATLLYGGQAVGGVVNIVDNSIPSSKLDSLQGGVELRLSDSALDERSGVLSLSAPLSDKIMGHVSYFKTETDSYEIPGFSESKILADSEGEVLDGDSEGFLENSDIDAKGFNAGLSYVYDNGYWGFSISDFDRNYGIPGHAHEDEHDDEEEDHEGDEHEEEEEEIVRIELDKRTYNIRGRHDFYSDFLETFKVNFTSTDYQHVELEGDEIGTVFDNEASEFRAEVIHKHALGFDGAFGIQIKNRDFSAIGEEAFILPSDTQSVGLFLIEERNFEKWHFEAGLRYDYQKIKTNSKPAITHNGLSLSTGATINLSDEFTLPINFSHASRLPTAEELFSNQSGADELIPHLATSTIEVGNPNLDKETANNFDIGLRYRKNNLKVDVAFFHNKMKDFIFLNSTGTENDEFPVFEYQQQDATFKGFELEVAKSWTDSWDNQWELSFLADQTKAEDNQGNALPRIPASKIGGNLNFSKAAFNTNLRYTKVSKQDDLAQFELPTNGYELLNFDASYVFNHGLIQSTLFFKANNLLDEEIRDHASFIKDIAPRPGRSISTGFRINF